MARYKPVKMPREAYDNYMRKIKAMEETLAKEGKKNIKIHFTDGVRFFSQRPVYLENQELVEYFLKKKRRMI